MHDGRGRVACQLRFAAVVLATCTAACSVTTSADQVYTMAIDASAPLPAEWGKSREADARLPQVVLRPDFMGMKGSRLVSAGPIGDVREGVAVIHDLRDRPAVGTDVLSRLPGIETKYTLEIRPFEGGADMVRSLSLHPVMLTRIRIDCRRGTLTHLSFHTADTFTGRFAYTFAPKDAPTTQVAGDMKRKLCSGAPSGLTNPRDDGRA